MEPLPKFLVSCTWKQIVGCLLSYARSSHPKRIFLKHFVEGIWPVAKSGCPWRLLPTSFADPLWLVAQGEPTLQTLV